MTYNVLKLLGEFSEAVREHGAFSQQAEEYRSLLNQLYEQHPAPSRPRPVSPQSTNGGFKSDKETPYMVKKPRSN